MVSLKDEITTDLSFEIDGLRKTSDGELRKVASSLEGTNKMLARLQTKQLKSQVGERHEGEAHKCTAQAAGRGRPNGHRPQGVEDGF